MWEEYNYATPIHIYLIEIYLFQYIGKSTQKLMSDKISQVQFRTVWKCKFTERKRECHFVCLSKRPPDQIALGISSVYRNENWLEILKANVILFIVEWRILEDTHTHTQTSNINDEHIWNINISNAKSGRSEK